MLRSLRARTALWTSALLFVALAALGAFLYLSLADGLERALDESLTLVASQVVAGLDIEQNRLVYSTTFASEPENVDFRARGFGVRVLAPDGALFYAFGPTTAFPQPDAATLRGPIFTTLNDAADGPQRLVTLPMDDGGQRVAVVQVAQSRKSVQDVLDRLLTALALSVPLWVVLAGGGGYFLAVRALAPIDQITRTAQRISAEDLTARLNLPPTNDEVGRLAQTFDAMLARLDESFRRERRFAADASHELRTPLTALQTILGTTLQKRRSLEAYESALADLADETQRLSTLAETLLQLARTEQGADTVVDTVDLSTLLQDLGESFRPAAEVKGLTLTWTVADALSLAGDRDALVRLFANLLDNAIKYTERGEVRLTAGRDGPGDLVVVVDDTGIGIPLEHRPHVFERFYRVDPSRSAAGAGLGLALAQEIARAHQGQIDVGSARDGGARFVVVFPTRIQPAASDSIA